MVFETPLKLGKNVVVVPAGSVFAGFYATTTGKPVAVITFAQSKELQPAELLVVRNGEPMPQPEPGMTWRFLDSTRRRFLGIFPMRRLVLLIAVPISQANGRPGGKGASGATVSNPGDGGPGKSVVTLKKKNGTPRRKKKTTH